MNEDNIKQYNNPAQNIVKDSLSEFLKESAEKMLKIAIESEVNNFISSYQEQKLPDGNQDKG